MKHIITLSTRDLEKSVEHGGCGECQTSCQSACKTSCGIAIKTARTKTTKDFSEEGAVCRHSSFFSPLIETLSLCIDYLYTLIIFILI